MTRRTPNPPRAWRARALDLHSVRDRKITDPVELAAFKRLGVIGRRGAINYARLAELEAKRA